MQVAIRTEGPVTVVQLIGALDRPGPLDREDVDRLRAVFQAGGRIQVDLSRVEEFSPELLRVLLVLYRRGRALGGIVSFIEAPQELRDLADVTGFLAMDQMPPPPEAALPLAPFTLPRIDVYPTHRLGGHAYQAGRPYPLGAWPAHGGVNFAVFSAHARSCTLVLFDKGARQPIVEIPFPDEFRVGNVFAMTVFGLEVDRVEYGFRMNGPNVPREGHRFDPARVLLDPYARAIAGRGDVWATPHDPADPYPFRACLVPDDFDWEGDRPPGHALADLVICEMHVRGFTASPSTGVRFPGTFAGLREKIPYLQELGINCVELMPIFEFDELETDRTNPRTGERLVNYWGYSTVGFWAPKAGYAAGGRFGVQVDELKALIKELHRAGIEVILDVVFNHTAEGGDDGPTLSFRGLDNRTWYMLTPDGHYLNFSGCGNTLNCNHPVVREFVRNCLRYWVAEFHVDGFRFDLASILGRSPDGEPLHNPPLLESLAGDAVLGRTKLIAEAWDAGGLYQVGTFPAYGRWAEWNGKFRDGMRRFLRGDFGMAGEVVQRLAGSPDLYPKRGPSASVNFVTCHDGFTLADLVSYEHKHNEDNGEDNRDGSNENWSSNYGVEGPTDDPAISDLRKRQMKNALAMLFLSQGVPMLLMGDECGRTQQGNNNAYCHDGPLVWFDWTLTDRNADLLRFCRLLIALRRRHPALRHSLHAGRTAEGIPALDLSWHGTLAWRPDWTPGSRVVAMMLRLPRKDAGDDAIYVALNMHTDALTFSLPDPPPGQRWHVFANTALPSPQDVYEPGSEPPLEPGHALLVGGRSIVILV